MAQPTTTTSTETSIAATATARAGGSAFEALAGKRNKQRASRRIWKRVLLSVFVLAVAGSIGWTLRPKPLVVESAVATRTPMRVTVDEDGVARIQDRYVVSAPLSGHLERIELNPGDQVKAGATLARILPIAAPLLDERTRREAQARLAMAIAAERQSKLQVERARERYAFAREDAARKHSLEAHRAIAHELVDQAELLERTTATELESLRFGQQVANHEAEMARATLGRMSGPNATEQLEIRSPVEGRILRLIQKSEGVVQPGTPLLEIGDANALEIAVDVLTSDAVRIQPSARVLFERWGGPTLEGRVRRMEPSAFTRISALGVEEQRVNVLVDLTSPRTDWARLGDGYRVETRIVVWEGTSVLQIPASAVFRRGEEWAVFKIVSDKTYLTNVALGERTPHSVAITRGLVAGDRVVLHPSDQVRDGASVSLH